MFEQSNVPGHQSRRGETKDLPKGEVPGHYGEHWTKRLETHVTLLRIRFDDLIGEMTFTGFSIIPANPRALFRFTDGSFYGLTHFGCHHFCKRELFSLEDLRRALHFAGTVGERGVTVRTKCVCRELELFVDLRYG